MRLSELQDSKKVEEFTNGVVADVKKRLKKEISTNKGLKKDDELLNLIMKGKNSPFDYKVLIESSEGF